METETREAKYTLEETGRIERKLNKIYEKLLDLEEHIRYVESERQIKETEREIECKQDILWSLKNGRFNSYDRKQQSMKYFDENY